MTVDFEDQYVGKILHMPTDLSDLRDRCKSSILGPAFVIASSTHATVGAVAPLDPPRTPRKWARAEKAEET